MASSKKQELYLYCFLQPAKPPLLQGPLAGVDKIVNLQVFQKGLDYPVFEADVRMPPLP